MTADADLRSVSDLLYGLPPTQFTTERDAQAAHAREAGDADLAAAIKKLQRPTASAALVNLLVRENREQIEVLLDIGDRLRQAQENLAADDLRKLSQQRRTSVADLVKDAKRLAAEHDQTASDAVLGQIRSTLEAASADETAAAALREGALTKPLQYSGFGAGLISEPAKPPAATRSRPSKRASVTALDTRRALRDAEAAVEHARDGFLAAERDLSAARLRTEDARRVVLGLEEELLSAREKLATAKREQTSAGHAHSAAQRDLDSAETTRKKAATAADRSSP
jgi:hypothetical protein